MHSRLIEILQEKKGEVAKLKKAGLSTRSRPENMEIRDFKTALSAAERINLIAEIKFASPSAGLIREKTDPAAIGTMYEKAGASAISLLTDEKFFGGNLEHLIPLKSAVGLPVLRKDFIIDEIQVRESLISGADAILLIVRILSGQQLKELLAAARESGLAVLTEIHNLAELDTALDSGAEIIGINNRNLDTFEVDIRTTLKIAPRIPDDRLAVSESGIFTGQDIHLIKSRAVRAVLVGTAIMKSDHPAEKIRELVSAGRA
ncbi:MAG: indole-3-glycerol phosphate synthase TrpC [Deltaproteobacteria bacterium]|nr:MAG: indole-3-glycerol phosphate synthase TrpC [Deltaproteobacteria bacterium]